MLQDIENRTIFINDNLDVMRKLEGETIDLIYLDPPFGNMQTWKANNSKKITEIKNYFIELQQTKGCFREKTLRPFLAMWSLTTLGKRPMSIKLGRRR